MLFILYTEVDYYFKWQPDPLVETLESVVGGRDSMDGRLKAAEADAEVINFAL